MTAQALQTTNANERTLSGPLCSPGLTSWLGHELRATAISEIADNPALLTEARRVLPELKRRALAPAGQGGVERVILRRTELFPQPTRTPAEHAMWMADYVEVLEGLTEASLEAGMKAWIAQPDAEFMPKPGKLRELAQEATTRAAEAAFQADAAVRLADSRIAPGFAERRRIPRERFDALMDEFHQGISASNAETKAGWPKRRVG